MICAGFVPVDGPPFFGFNRVCAAYPLIACDVSLFAASLQRVSTSHAIVPHTWGDFIRSFMGILNRRTNDHLRSTVHRVINKLGRERYSIAIFLDPDFDTEVKCCSMRLCWCFISAHYSTWQAPLPRNASKIDTQI